VEALVGRLVTLREATSADAVAFRDVLSHPHVARWWGDPDEQLSEVLDPPDGISSFAIILDGKTVGLIQSDEELTPDYRHAGLDLAVHPDWHGRGIGTDAIVTLARHLIDERGHHRLTIDPALENEVAISAYRRIGFRPVGVLRQYERGPNGTWRDGLLMDLLADELVTPGPQ
jgi:aminoglycoside 6'-N-acetyltransferase